VNTRNDILKLAAGVGLGIVGAVVVLTLAWILLLAIFGRSRSSPGIAIPAGTSQSDGR
jgi:hypothetical protein